LKLAGEDPDDPVQPPPADGPRPWLVIVDGRGRLTRLGWLRGQPFWREVLVLCCAATPAEHLERLRRHHVEHLVVGAQHVDLAAALHQLAEGYGVREVRVDAGGTLNGLLVRAGLVDELSLVVAPQLAGDGQAPAVHLVEGLSSADAPQLTLAAVERLADSHLWLRYTVAAR
jgi:2,5-diamino-6-(ribosylamino)-4(3H)-pyrimidinone 5'-phosphate reductase